jgi:hypothetical protein
MLGYQLKKKLTWCKGWLLIKKKDPPHVLKCGCVRGQILFLRVHIG